MSSVSRETSAQMDRFVNELIRWNRKINLVSAGTLSDLRARHVKDSLQLLDLAPTAKQWLDLGSGGGFPAVPIAIHYQGLGPKLTLVEADQRKCVFLRTVSRLFDLDLKVVNARIEGAPAMQSDIISARALAPLSQLLTLAVRHAYPHTTFLFPKGENWSDEVDSARRDWHFDLEAIPSITHTDAAVLRIQNVRQL